MKGKKLSAVRRAYIGLMKGLMWLSAGLTTALTAFLIVYVLAKGVPNITWKLLSTAPSYLTGDIGILPDILNTLYIVLATIVIVVPLGVGAAIYLTEYARNKGSSVRSSTPPRPSPASRRSSTALWVCWCANFWACRNACWQVR